MNMEVMQMWQCMNALGTSSMGALLKLNKIASRKIERMAQQQLAVMRDCFESAVNQLKILSEAEGVQDVLQGQTRFVNGCGEKWMANTRKAFELSLQAQTELSQWMNESFGRLSPQARNTVEQAQEMVQATAEQTAHGERAKVYAPGERANCDIVAGDFSGTTLNGTCSKRTIAVDGTGQAKISVSPNDAAAIHVNARPGGPQPLKVTFTVQDAYTYWGQHVYLIGDDPLLGSWSAPIKMSPTSYPTWQVTTPVPAGQAIQFKFVKIDNAGNWSWELNGLPNRSESLPGSGSPTLTKTWDKS